MAPSLLSTSRNLVETINDDATFMKTQCLVGTGLPIAESVLGSSNKSDHLLSMYSRPDSVLRSLHYFSFSIAFFINL